MRSGLADRRLRRLRSGTVSCFFWLEDPTKTESESPRRHLSSAPNRALSRLASPFATLGLFAGCGSPVINPVTGEAERSVMDERAMIASGKEGQDRVLVEYGVIEDARLRVYLNQVGQGLAAQSHRAHLKSLSLCSTAR